MGDDRPTDAHTGAAPEGSAAGDTPVRAAPAKGDTGARKGTAKKGGTKKSTARKAGAKKAAAKKSPGTRPAARPATTVAETNTPADDGAAAPDAAPATGQATGSAKPGAPSTRHFPVHIFLSVLGIGGLGIAWREAAESFSFTPAVGELFLGFAAGFYIAVLALYGLKALRHPDAVIADFVDPVRGSYFAAAGMGLLLMAAAARPHGPEVAEILWALGAPVTLAITMALTVGWMRHEFHMRDATPVWFLPISGNLLAAIAVPPGYEQIGWMIFAVGLVLWLMLQGILFYRLMFEAPLAHGLRPTMAIMLAPPALAAIAYQVLTNGAVLGAIGGFGTMLHGLALFVAVLLLVQAPSFLRLPFGMTAWSYPFPLAAFTVAATLHGARHAHWVADAIAIAALALTTLVTLIVFAKTAQALMAGHLFRLPAAKTDPED